jgi:SAM-dependent methyltransferase
MNGMGGGFSGDAAAYYARYRRGYPAAVIDALVAALDLTAEDTVIDLGCGTGQLAVRLATRVGLVIGVDPEPDMLAHAETAATDGVGQLRWTLGTAADLTGIAAEHNGVGAITLANAIHLVDRRQLFLDAASALRPGRGLAIIANGTPLWLQDNAWSVALRAHLERWIGRRLTNHCGTDDETRAGYRAELNALGYEVTEVRVTYSDTLTVDEIVGGVFSAMSDRVPAAEDRSRFAAELSEALSGIGPYREDVNVRALIGYVR